MRAVFIKVDVEKSAGKYKVVCTPNNVVVDGERCNLFWHLTNPEFEFAYHPIRVKDKDNSSKSEAFPQDEIRLCENVAMLMDYNPTEEKFSYRVVVKHKKTQSEFSADPGISNGNKVPTR